MKLLVQKFGGSSLTTDEMREKVIKKITSRVNNGYKLVVVVSAMGRNGSPYATDTLLGLLENKHQKLEARELDLLMSCGEIISGVVLVNALADKGYKATCLTGPQAGIITDNNHQDARILKVDIKKILKTLEEDKIVIVTGFQGRSEEGEITTLGRGGSDTSASALGVALKAEAIEIYTDVDGIKTADPRIVSSAKTLGEVNYNEVCQLAIEGAKVIHPRAVEIAMQQNIPLWVKCTFDDTKGTLVTNQNNYEQGGEIKERLITGIAHIPELTQFKVTYDKKETNEVQKMIFKKLAQASISVDFINISPRGAIFTVKGKVADRAEEILTKFNLSISRNDNCAKVAAVGAGMTGVPGIMARIVEALADEDIKILQSADSYTTIWCLVEEKDMEKAVQALHAAFDLDKEKQEPKRVG